MSMHVLTSYKWALLKSKCQHEIPMIEIFMFFVQLFYSLLGVSLQANLRTNAIRNLIHNGEVLQANNL